ncbi:MAG: SPASM domain-containing protein [Candidatus Eisenbacteria bacterium]
MFIPTYNSLSCYVQRHFSTLLPFVTAFKARNILLALYEMQARRTVCRSRPFVYRVDPCTLCNLRCAPCESHKTRTNEKRMMDLADFRRIADKIRHHTLRLSLYDMGEPLLNKDIYAMIAYAGERCISTLVSTNFNLFKREHLDALFDSRLTVLEPCLDGFTQEGYDKYRKGGDVEAVKSGIKMVMEEKRWRKARWPVVDVQVVAFDHIRNEMPLIDGFLKGCRVDKVTHRQDNLGINSPATPTAPGSQPSRSACFWLYLGMTIRPDGNVYPCCGRGFDRFPYGNILRQDLSEIWNNKCYQFSRALFRKGPDLREDKEIEAVPCITCGEFEKRRRVVRK